MLLSVDRAKYTEVSWVNSPGAEVYGREDCSEHKAILASRKRPNNFSLTGNIVCDILASRLSKNPISYALVLVH